jgi:uncharacterized membrane protein (UPF0127 family)
MKCPLLGLLVASLVTTGALAQGDEPKGPQPELPKEKLVIVTHDGKQYPFNIEMATTDKQQQTGEMFRTSIPDDGGMLFDWGKPKPTEMWMKNTLVPLDMVFINQDGTIQSIAEDTVPRSLAVIDAGGPVRAALELSAGTTAKLGINVGDSVKQRIFGNGP